MLDHAPAPVIELVTQRVWVPVLEDFLVHRKSPIRFCERLIDGRVKPDSDLLRRYTIAADPAHVVQARDHGESLATFKDVRRPVEHAVKVIDDEVGGLPPPFELSK